MGDSCRDPYAQDSSLKIEGDSVHKRLNILVRYLCLLILAAIFVGPFYWLLVTSLSGSGDIYAFPPRLFPSHLTFHNYVEVWQAVPMARFFLNTVIIVFFGTTLTLFLSALAGYPLARMDFPGKKLIFIVLLATLMLPEEGLLIINFLTCSRLGLTNTYLGVFLPSIASVFGIILLRQAYLSIPKEIEDAARIDGCGHFSLWWRIMLPLVSPALATLAVFCFCGLLEQFSLATDHLEGHQDVSLVCWAYLAFRNVFYKF